MTMQFGSRVAEPVGLGKRVGARVIMLIIFGVFTGITQLMAEKVAMALLFGEPLSAGESFLYYGSWIVAVVLGIWNLVLLFTGSTTLGAKPLGVQWIVSQTGEDAKAKLFLKYLLQALFEGATLGLGAISYFFTYRDGQHWVDRALGLVAVEKGSIGSAHGARASMPGEAPVAPMVRPVAMPRQAVPPTAPSPGVSAAFNAVPSGVAPQLSQPPMPSRPSMSQPPAPPQPTHARPPRAAANPWSRPQDEPLRPTAPHFFGGPPDNEQPARAFCGPPTGSSVEPASAPPPFSPASVASSFGASPVAPAFGAPPAAAPFEQASQNRFGVPPAPSAPPAPVVAAPARSSMLDDHTAVDVEDNAPVVKLDDGQEIRIEGAVVLGRNPSPPAAYPQARPVSLLDESMRLSKTHVVLVPLGSRVGIFDVGSTNGVSVETGGNKVKMVAQQVHELPVGAVLHVGGRSLQVRQ